MIASGHEPGVIGEIAKGNNRGTLFSRTLLMEDPTLNGEHAGNGVVAEEDEDDAIRAQVGTHCWNQIRAGAQETEAGWGAIGSESDEAVYTDLMLLYVWRQAVAAREAQRSLATLDTKVRPMTEPYE